MKRGWRTFLVPEEKLRTAMELYPGKSREEIRDLLSGELLKRLRPGILAAVFFLVMALVSGRNTKEEGIIRPAPGKAATQVRVEVDLGETSGYVPLEVGALEYEEDRIEELHREAEFYLDEVILGENQSLQLVVTDLTLQKSLPSTGGTINWTTDAPWLVTAEGKVLNEELEEARQVQITAEISYGSEVRYFSRIITVCPAVYTGEEAVLRAIQKELTDWEIAGRKAERLVLPEQVMGYRIAQMQASVFSVAGFFVLVAFAVPALLYSAYFSKLDSARKERKERAEGCYTEFITKLSLMLAAGISVRQAFVRLTEEYERNYGSKHVLAEELKITKAELDNGGSETVVYEEFGRRIGVLAYRRMASLLTRNVSKGVQGMRTLLLQEAKEVMAQERATIRQKGEQAGTKLLLPMMGLLFLVFAILLVPAFQTF